MRNRGLVLGMAIDWVDDQYQVAVQLPVELQFGGGGEPSGGVGAGQRSADFVGRGVDIDQAMGRLESRVGRRLYFGHVLVVAVGEALAQRGLEHAVRRLMRDPEVWPLAAVVVVPQGQGLDVLRGQPPLEPVPTMHILKLVRNRVRMGLMPDMPLERFYVEIRAPGTQAVLPLMAADPSGAREAGLAVFQHDRMVGTLDPNETRRFLNLVSRHRGGRLVVPCPGRPETIEFRVSDSRPKVQLLGTPDRPEFRVRVTQRVSLQEIPCRELVPLTRAALEPLATEEATRLHSELVQRVQREMGADIFGFGARLRGRYPWAFDRERWQEQFRTLPVRVEVQVQVQRLGLIKEGR